MRSSNSVRSSLFAAALFLAIISPARADECADLVDQFNEAVDAGRDGDAQILVDKIATHGLCGSFQVPVQRRLAAFRLRAAQDLMARGRPTEEYEKLLEQADRPEVLWQAAATLAEVRFGERRFAEAAMGFDRAIETVKNEALTPTAPSKFEIQELLDRAAQSRLLAANVGTADKEASFVATVSDKRDGRLGGVYSPSVRGIVLHALPLPITFDYDKSVLTTIGEQAARELLRAIQEQQPVKVVVVGHTDVRGGAEHNLKLSNDRAQTVATFLRQNGLTTPIEVVGVGANEPMRIADSAGLTQEDIYAVNRRVEWRRD
jgi:outer membrane protein OmpA-like peptidoglycan-associated protein